MKPPLSRSHLTTRAETLRHDPTIGEVNPNTYFELCKIKLKCEQIGNTERRHQLNRLSRAVDLLLTELGEPRSRVFFLATPNISPKQQVEVRVQFCTVSKEVEDQISEKLKARLPELVEQGKTAGWSILP